MRRGLRKLVVILIVLLYAIICSCISGNTEAKSDNSSSSSLENPNKTLEGMVLIPKGEFLMGSNHPNCSLEEQPVHNVYIDNFYIDMYEVTNSQFKKFIDANPQWQKRNWWNPKAGIDDKYHDGEYLKNWKGNNFPEGKGKFPVVHVSWYAAMAYANWVGKRLPTEAEWEKAARGGLEGLDYPWGNTINPSHASYPPHGGPDTPIGLFPPNAYGIYDMIGNVMEWCLDAYDPQFYRNSPYRNPIAGAEKISQVVDNYLYIKNERVTRGLACCPDPMHLRIAFRDHHFPLCSHMDNGFRCVISVPPE